MEFVRLDWQSPDSYCENFSALPNASGIYLLVSCEIDFETIRHRVLYVGKSRNIYKRLKCHEMLPVLWERFRYIQRYFRRYPTPRIDDLERKFIRGFNPPYNIVHRIRGL